ncbi:hypothetical protein [Actinomadura fibrosa]|uniref:Uncharacterized protein n=2 Tax=Actinomadura fibrosa TaxID=111802 RepID=A0ABW2XXU7_9ACTN
MPAHATHLNPPRLRLVGGAVAIALVAAPSAGPALAAGPAGPGPRGCPHTRGAADAMFDRDALCRNVESEIGSGHPDLGRALRGSVRGRAHRPPVRMGRPEHGLFPGKARPARPKVPVRPGTPARPGFEQVRPEREPTRHKPIRRQVEIPVAEPPSTDAPAAPHGRRHPEQPASAPTVQGHETATTANGAPGGATPTTVAVILLLAAFALHQRFTRRVPVPRPLARHRRHLAAASRAVLHAAPMPAVEAPPTAPAAAPPAAPADATATASELAHPSGLGVVGPGADGFMRAVLVDLLTRDGPHAKIVLTRGELHRLFGDALTGPLRTAFDARLHVCDLLEEAIEQLELEMLVADAERANPDLSPTGGQSRPVTYWLSTPGEDDDVVVPVIRRGPAHGLVGLVFGTWPHGRTCTVDDSGVLTETGEPDETGGPDAIAVATLSLADALARLREYTEREAWF